MIRKKSASFFPSVFLTKDVFYTEIAAEVPYGYVLDLTHLGTGACATQTTNEFE